MLKVDFIINGKFDAEPGKPEFQARLLDISIPHLCPETTLEVAIPGGIIFPDFNKMGVCKCVNFSQCCYPNKPWPGRCSENDLSEAYKEGKGPGGHWYFPMKACHIVVRPGREKVDVVLSGATMGIHSREALMRAGFVLFVKPMPEVADADSKGG
jgi:hypothetical protein